MTFSILKTTGLRDSVCILPRTLSEGRTSSTSAYLSRCCGLCFGQYTCPQQRLPGLSPYLPPLRAGGHNSRLTNLNLKINYLNSTHLYILKQTTTQMIFTLFTWTGPSDSRMLLANDDASAML